MSTIGPYWPLATALRMRSVCSSDKPGSRELAQPTTDIGTFRFTTRLPPSVTSIRMCRGDPWTPAGDDGGIGGSGGRGGVKPVLAVAERISSASSAVSTPSATSRRIFSTSGIDSVSSESARGFLDIYLAALKGAQDLQ